MTAAIAAPGVKVTRVLLGYPTRKVSDAVAALL